MILSNNSVCGESSVWNVQFSDGSTCEASLKKQDKNSHLAVFGVRRNLISESTWDEIKTAVLGNSNIVAEGDPVIALGDTFGYSDGTGYGMISSNAHEKAIPDHTFSVLATDIPSAILVPVFCVIWTGRSSDSLIPRSGQRIRGILPMHMVFLI